MKIFDKIYFLGIGGIGMSNLARYFMAQGKIVGGYDKTPSELTRRLESEGAKIHYDDKVESIPDIFRQKENVLVVYTPAIPADSIEYLYFKNNYFEIKKRAEVLGIITQNTKALCCAGTHGKTTTSTMLAHIFTLSSFKCNAFLGGIMKNYDTNLILSASSEYTVVEADEYDRSFHSLHPYMALITSVTPDHLDIYGTESEYKKSFEKFVSLIAEGGSLVIHTDADLNLDQAKQKINIYTYSLHKGDFCADNIKICDGKIIFDFVTPKEIIRNIELGVPIKINIENAIGAMALAWLNNIPVKILKEGISTYAGTKRRFDFHVKRNDLIYIDDYAHHPEELEASVTSVRELYPDKKITGIFQPHLYTRTRDFADEFAKSLSLLDELILMDIYPAREKPIEGINSEMLRKKISCPSVLLTPEEILCRIEEQKNNIEILLTLGAGDIEKLVKPIKNILVNCEK